MTVITILLEVLEHFSLVVHSFLPVIKKWRATSVEVHSNFFPVCIKIQELIL